MTDFEKQISFIMELDKIKKITRQTYLSDGSRKENDAEHSWHLALMAFVFADYANEKLRQRVSQVYGEEVSCLYEDELRGGRRT